MNGPKEDNRVGLEVIDTSNALTKEELLELKKLASLTKATKLFVGIAIGVVSALGVQPLFEWIAKHFH